MTSIPHNRLHLSSSFEDILLQEQLTALNHYMKSKCQHYIQALKGDAVTTYDGCLRLRMPAGRRTTSRHYLPSASYGRGVRKDHAKGCKLTTFMKEFFSEDYTDSVPGNIKISNGVQGLRCSFHTWYVRCICMLVLSGNRGHFDSFASRP